MDHERQVRSLAWNYARRLDLQSHLDDLQQEARIGFWQAERRYRPETGLSFYTLGYYYAKRQMGHYVRALRCRPSGTDAGLEELLVDERDPDQVILARQIFKAIGSGRDAEIYLKHLLVERGQRTRGIEEPGSARSLAQEYGIDRATVGRIVKRESERMKMWINGQYSVDWVYCEICRVKQPKECIGEDSKCKDRERCIKWCREPNREWVQEEQK